MDNDRLKSIYKGIKQRCYYEKRKDYRYYGGKGIKMCDEWKNNRNSFIEWALNNGYEDCLTIDRIDNNGDYEPSNCKWEQSRKNLSKQTHNGITNKIDVVGVYKDESRKKKRFRAHIKINGKSIYLGGFETLEEASMARTNAEIKYFGVKLT